MRNSTVYDFLRKGGDTRPRVLLIQVGQGGRLAGDIKRRQASIEVWHAPPRAPRQNKPDASPAMRALAASLASRASFGIARENSNLPGTWV